MLTVARGGARGKSHADWLIVVTDNLGSKTVTAALEIELSFSLHRKFFERLLSISVKVDVAILLKCGTSLRSVLIL